MHAKMWMAGAAGAVVLLAAGCGVAGEWELSQVDPTAARRDVDFQALTLQDDGTFYAEAMGPDGIRTISGTYTYDGGVLALTEHSGLQHAYDVELADGGDQMRIHHLRRDGQVVRATFVRDRPN